MGTHPYQALPQHAFWSRAVAKTSVPEVDPVIKSGFCIDRAERVATAGSCFAQHIARYLSKSGFNYYVAESAHPIVAADLAGTYGYGTFSARYGNVYTTRQLVQLFQRAYGHFVPMEQVWFSEKGHLLDPFRPTIQPGGFVSLEDLEADRSQHLACVRRMFEELGTFVFTLGLTEVWSDARDGAVFPVCPGVVGGSFDSERHVFRNLTIDEVVTDMLYFIDALRSVNPGSRVILTVSPVPLAATAQADVHVLSATTYSKSVLRVAAELVSRQRPDVAYFPSYEIITGSFNRGSYFAEDLRSVTEDGVRHVMRLFLKHYAGLEDFVPDPAEISREGTDIHVARMAELVSVNCDEAWLDQRASEIQGQP